MHCTPSVRPYVRLIRLDLPLKNRSQNVTTLLYSFRKARSIRNNNFDLKVRSYGRCALQILSTKSVITEK